MINTFYINDMNLTGVVHISHINLTDVALIMSNINTAYKKENYYEATHLIN